MLDHITVETSGLKMPSNLVALVSVIDPNTLSVNPYYPQTLKTIRKYYFFISLGLNPKSDALQSIRRARQKAMDAIKKVYSSLPRDGILLFYK
ncbi:Ribosome-recycling factor [Spatholobus suberectus]|nr:Ribosome-recycling factor [Spatholobus suberectus]